MEFAKVLLDKGYDLNRKVPSNNQSVLSLAVTAHQTEMVRWLLDNGADPNIEDNLEWKPYDIARFRGYQDIADILEKHK